MRVNLFMASSAAMVGPLKRLADCELQHGDDARRCSPDTQTYLENCPAWQVSESGGNAFRGSVYPDAVVIGLFPQSPCVGTIHHDSLVASTSAIVLQQTHGSLCIIPDGLG